ncbi:hypothetical protein FACS189472_09010 [Alphaproteobacteria bacterium]|nr:hypothetical protein FACS189472_09010 [Alphaproteobacteria bacterium]
MKLLPGIIEDFAKRCGETRFEKVTELENVISAYKARIFQVGEHTIKLTNQCKDELMAAQKLHVCSSAKNVILDTDAYKFIAPAKYAIYKSESGTFSEVKDVITFSENEVSTGDLCLLFMDTAIGVHLLDSQFKEIRDAVSSEAEFGVKLGNFYTNFGKACAMMKTLRLENKDLHNRNYFFDLITSKVTFIDITFAGELTYLDTIIKNLWRCHIFSGIAKHVPQCVGNFFDALYQNKRDVLTYFGEDFFVHAIADGTGWLNETIRKSNPEDLISNEQKNALLSETMERIRPYLKKAECPSASEFFSDLKEAAEYRMKWKIDIVKIDKETGGYFSNFWLWKLFICKSDSKEEADNILRFILEFFQEGRKPWHTKMLDLMCKS